MSKLLLSTSLVVALMASGAALYADEPDPEPVPELDTIGAPPADVANDAATSKTDNTSYTEEEHDINKVLEALEAQDGDKFPGLTTQEATDLKNAVDAVADQEKLLDEAVASTEAAKDEQTQASNFENVTTELSNLTGNVKHLSGVVRKYADKITDPKVVNELEQDEASLKTDVTAEETDATNVANADQATEEQEKAVLAEEKSAIDEDAKLADSSEQEAIAKKTHVTLSAVQDSMNNALALLTDLKNSGIDVSGAGSKHEELLDAWKNLTAIYNDMVQNNHAINAKRVVAPTTKK